MKNVAKFVRFHNEMYNFLGIRSYADRLLVPALQAGEATRHARETSVGSR